MIKMKHKLIFEPVFRTETLFYSCKDGKYALAHAKKKYNCNIKDGVFDGYNGICVGLICKETKADAWMIWVSSHPDWKTMSHEASHLVFRILDSRGVKYSSGNDETWCYLHEYFEKVFWNVMCRK
jgi:hypothetical protein